MITDSVKVGSVCVDKGYVTDGVYNENDVCCYYFLSGIEGLEGLEVFCNSLGIDLEVRVREGGYKLSELLDSIYCRLELGDNCDVLNFGCVLVVWEEEGGVRFMDVLRVKEFVSNYDILSGRHIIYDFLLKNDGGFYLKSNYCILDKNKLNDLLEDVYSGLDMDEKVQSSDYPWINNADTRYHLDRFRGYLSDMFVLDKS